jgi:hypothetical protein
VTQPLQNLDELGRDLHAAVGRLIDRRRRRQRVTRSFLAATLAVGTLAVGALASGLGPDLQLDPTKWTILGRGEIDDGRGEFVHARENASGEDSLFMVEHDDGIDRYEAFLLHERVKESAQAAAGRPAAETGPLCTRAQLTRAEVVTLEALRAEFPSGTPPAVTKAVADRAVGGAFADERCRGLEYAGERARFVFGGVEPERMLMPGAR